MRNEYQAVGRLIMNLRNGRFIEEGEEFMLELQEEFNDITLQLGHYWMEHLDGWEYNLDFHRAEAERLRDFVDFEAGKASAMTRLFMYEQLTEQMRRLDLLINGE
jgi:hypothetical protein